MKKKIKGVFLMARRKTGSLYHQTKRELKKLDCIGQSKHQAKKIYRAECKARGEIWNPAKARGIHSIATMRGYEQTAKEFTTWMKVHHPAVKNINQIEREHMKSYLLHRQERGLSAWTTSKDMAALNKIFDANLTKREVGLRERSYHDTTRSRAERTHDNEVNRANYQAQIDIASAFGLRRESICGGQYQLKDVSIYKLASDDKLYAAVIEKGGRYRVAPCLRSHQKHLETRYPQIGVKDSHMEKESFKTAYMASENVLFNKYPHRIDNHELRHQYARELYEELVEQKGHDDANYRGYDKKILEYVSEALGHSRPSVVVEYYLR